MFSKIKEINDANLTAYQIVIIGAKPSAALPDIPAPFVLTANAAVILGLEYRKKYKSKIIAVVSSSDLLTRPDMQKALTYSQPDEIIFLGEYITKPEDYVKNHLDLKNTIVKVINFRDLYYLIAETLGWRTILFIIHQVLSRGLRSALYTIIPDLFGARTYAWMSRSTGLNATMYALKRFPNCREVIVAGVGLQSGGHSTGTGTFAAKTAKVDRITMKYWPPHRRPKVYTTDDVMNKSGNVPKWEGKIFYFKPIF